MISVIIPTYNHRDYVGATLDSVFAQTFRDYEVIVINDGSPDDTAQVLRPLIDSGRIRYYQQENQGQASARNRGVAEARGEYIALLDDDDLWPSDKLQWQFNALQRHPDAVLVYGDYTRIEVDGSFSPPVHTRCPSGHVAREFLLGCWIISPGQTLMHANALRRAGGFDPRIWGSDDWELYIRLCRLGPFHHERRVALNYRVHPTGASHRAVQHVENHFKVMRKHIGWNMGLWRASLREGSRYYVGRLLTFGHSARVAGNFRDSLKAHLYAFLFRPSLLLRKSFWAPVIGSILSIRPRAAAISRTDAAG